MVMTIEFLENYIHQLIINQFPSQFIDCILDPLFVDDVTTQLIFEVIKLDFDAQMDAAATSLRQHRKGIEKAIEDANGKEDIIAESAFIKDTVIPAMNAIRKAADEAETYVSKECWPLPSYGDLLFSVK